MGGLAMWQQRVEEFVRDQVGPPPAQVLEVGCGEGELANALARAGHSVTAIDPRAPEGPIFRRVGIEEFTDPGQFDYVVASLSLHHVEDLGEALDKIANVLLRPGAEDGDLLVHPLLRGGQGVHQPRIGHPGGSRRQEEGARCGLGRGRTGAVHDRAGPLVGVDHGGQRAARGQPKPRLVHDGAHED
jgi:SAM-dependent methyltransferase